MSSTLLVEGNDDEHVVKHLCRRLGLGEIQNITPMNSVEKLLTSLPVHLKESDLETLGILLDADKNPQDRWMAVRDRLRSAGYKIPDAPARDGIVLEGNPEQLRPRVGVWLMPDNQSRGMLEDLLIDLVRQDRLWDYTQSTIRALPERKFSGAHESKATLHTWLAWQHEPGKPYGLGITSGYFDLDQPLAQCFANWLRRLFFS